MGLGFGARVTSADSGDGWVCVGSHTVSIFSVPGQRCNRNRRRGIEGRVRRDGEGRAGRPRTRPCRGTPASADPSCAFKVRTRARARSERRNGRPMARLARAVLDHQVS